MASGTRYKINKVMRLYFEQFHLQIPSDSADIQLYKCNGDHHPGLDLKMTFQGFGSSKNTDISSS